MDFVMSWNLRYDVENIAFTKEESQIVRNFNKHYNDGVKSISETQSSMKELETNIHTDSKQVISSLKYEKQLLDRINGEIMTTKTNIELCGEKMLFARQTSERRVEEYREKENALRRQLPTIEAKIRDFERSANEAQRQFDAENQNLQTLRRQNDELQETQENTIIGGLSASVGAFGLGVVGIFFPPIEILALAVAAGGAVGMTATATAVIIQENLKTSTEKLRSLQSNVNNTRALHDKSLAELRKTRDDLCKVQKEKEKTSDDLQNESKKPEIFRLLMENLTNYQIIIQKWKLLVDNVVVIYDKHLSLPTTFIERITIRNNKNFMDEVEGILRKNQGLRNSIIGCEKYLSIKTS
jgi:chromosome segregation ATPase